MWHRLDRASGLGASHDVAKRGAAHGARVQRGAIGQGVQEIHWSAAFFPNPHGRSKSKEAR